MAQFDRTIPPGGEGMITLRVNTKGYQGIVRKSARVYTNDPANRIQTIGLEGFIRGAVALSPKSVFFQGFATETIRKTVLIRAGFDKPLKIQPVNFNLDKMLSYKIEEVQRGKLYQVHFATIPGTYNYFQGFLKLKTNYPETPEILIQIKGRFMTKSSSASLK